jgi:integrase
VSERLGHSKVGITLDTYSHVLPGMQEEAASKVDAALRVAMEKYKDN